MPFGRGTLGVLIHVLNLETGRVERVLKGHTNVISSLAFSPDGKFLASASNDKTAIIYSTATGEVVAHLQGHTEGLSRVVFSPDGTAVATASADKTVRVWPLKDIRAVKVLTGHTSHTHGIAWAPDGKTLATSGVDGTIRLWSREGAAIRTIAHLKDREIDLQVYHLRFTRDGKQLRSYVGHTGLITALSSSPTGTYFLTGSTDETIRIWHTERTEPLLSLFIAGRDWIAWTPEGYYAASAYGERLMGWQINNGHDKPANYYPAVQFHDSLFQPEVIRWLVPTGSLPRAIARAAKERKKPIAAVHVGQVLPPVVSIMAPDGAAGEIKVEGGKLEVRAKAQSAGNHPVTSLRLLLDGRPYLGRKGIQRIDAPKLGAAEATWTVVLPMGKHTIAVQAESLVSKGLSPTIEVTRLGGKPEQPNLYVLAIGVSAYPGKMKLNFAATDAEAIARVFREKTKGMYGKVDVKLITDAEATKDGILKGLNWMQSVMTPLDVGVFFFSGHGARSPEGTFYLVPVNAEPADLEGTLVSGEELKQALGDMPGRLLAMLDCCHSGSVADDLRSSRADGLARDLVTDDYGVVVMCSSLGREYSMESSQTKAGFFTLSVVEGLSGLADFNKDRVVHLSELHLYAAIRVRQLSEGAQNPVTGCPPKVRSFPLARP